MAFLHLFLKHLLQLGIQQIQPQICVDTVLNFLLFLISSDKSLAQCCVQTKTINLWTAFSIYTFASPARKNKSVQIDNFSFSLPVSSLRNSSCCLGTLQYQRNPLETSCIFIYLLTYLITYHPLEIQQWSWVFWRLYYSSY